MNKFNLDDRVRQDTELCNLFCEPLVTSTLRIKLVTISMNFIIPVTWKCKQPTGDERYQMTR